MSNYHNILHDDMRNGSGLRVTLFLSGCDHHCKNCQNPQTWDAESGIKLDRDAVKEIFYWLEKDYTSGLTFSGGDPIHPHNLYTVKYLAQATKAMDKNVWLYTGFTFEKMLKYAKSGAETAFLIKDILNNIDVLVDGEFVEELKDETYHWAGSTNQRVIDVPKSLELETVVLYKE